MYVSIIGRVMNSPNKVNLYRILDVEDGRVRDVTPEQLISVLKSNKLTLTNACVKNNVLVGCRYTLDKIPVITPNGCDKNAILVLAQSLDRLLIANCLGNYKLLPKSQFNNIKNYVVNATSYGTILAPTENDRLNKYYCSGLQNTTTSSTSNTTSGNNKVANTYTKSTQTPIKNLSQYDYSDVADPSTKWSLDKFRNYMRDNGYTYRLFSNGKQVENLNTLLDEKETYILDSVTPKCTKLKIPDCIKAVIRMYNTDDLQEIKLDTLILSSGIETIGAMANADCHVEIDNIYFYNDVELPSYMSTYYGYPETLFATGAFNGIQINKCANMPYNVTVCGMYNKVRAKAIELNKDTRKNIRYSFNDIVLDAPEIEITNTDSIADSYNNVQSLNPQIPITLKISSAVRRIRDSFNKALVQRIDFSEAVDLTSIIGTSFNELVVSELDFTGCEQLKEIGGYSDIFDNCSNLSKVILPRELSTLRIAFVGSKVAWLDVPESVVSITWGNDIRIKYKGTILRESLFNRYDEKSGHSIDISNATEISSCAFMYKSGIIDQNETYPNIVTLREKAFCHYNCLKFDTKCLPNVHELPDGLFNESEIGTLVINDNIKTIGDNILLNCACVDTVIISDKVENVSAHTLSKMSGTKVPKIYVVNNSNAHKVLSENKYNIQLIVKDSMGDIADEIHKNEDIRGNAKYKMTLCGTKYEYLLSEPYSKNIALLMGIIKKLETEELWSDVKPLDTSNFVHIKLGTIPELERAVYDVRNSDLYIKENYIQNAGYSNDESECTKYTKHFASICNMFTSILGKNERISKIESIEKFASLPLNYTTVYTDINDTILLCETMYDDKIKFEWLVIVMGDIIKYMVPFKKHVAFKSNFLQNNFINHRDELMTSNPYSIGNLCKLGDTLKQGMTQIQGATLPSEVEAMLNDRVKRRSRYCSAIESNNMLYVGGEVRTITGSRKPKYEEISAPRELLFYDIVAQKFVRARCIITCDEDTFADNKKHMYDIRDVKEATIIGLYDLDEWDLIPEKLKESMKDSISDEDNLKLLYSLTINETEKKALYEANDAFDIDRNQALCTFACQLSLVKNSGQALKRKGIMKVLEKLGFVKKTTKTMQNMVDYAKISRIKWYDEEICGDIKIIQYILDKGAYKLYYICELPQDYIMGKRGYIYESVSNLNNILSILNDIGNYNRAYMNIRKPQNRITDTDLSDSLRADYSVPLAIMKYRTAKKYIQFEICFDKLNGDTYLLSHNITDDRVHTLFRFKNLELAIDYFKNNLINGGQEYLRMTNIALGLNNRTFSVEFPLLKVRKYILKGLPNNYPIIGKEAYDIFNIMAKQPQY